jgi:putative peptidoglycan lipid II flippase
MGALKTTLSATLRLVLLLTVPAATWLAAMAGPLIALLYEHGRFGAIDTERTAAALAMYCVGLPAFAAVGVLTRTFYALGDTRRPVQASFVSVALNLALNLALMRPLGHVGLALATSITSIVNAGQLAFYLRRRLGPLEGRRMLGTLLRVGAAGGAAAALCAAGLALSGGRWHGGWMREAVAVGAGLLAGVPATWVLMRLLGVEELRAAEDLLRAVRDRLWPRR